jgi:hypothetical protein
MIISTFQFPSCLMSRNKIKNKTDGGEKQSESSKHARVYVLYFRAAAAELAITAAQLGISHTAPLCSVIIMTTTTTTTVCTSYIDGAGTHVYRCPDGPR